jgi:hypothetical protein
MPGTKTFVSGDTLTAADMNAYARGGLVMAYASVGTPQGSITTRVDLTGLSVTFTAIAGRLYKATFSGEINGSVAGDLAVAYITDGVGTLFRRGIITVPDLSGGAGYSTITMQRLFTFGAGSVTLKMQLERNAGTGTVALYAAGDSPAHLIVEDVGVA